VSDLGQERTLPVAVVDDDASVRDLVALALRRAGIDVRVADGGQAALELVEREPLGLMVIDISMPGMSGLEVVRRLRAAPETATLPIILMTGSGDDSTVIEGLGTGADDFLPKPVRLDELVARVRAHLRRQAAWSSVLEEELKTRTAAVAALGGLRATGDAESMAMAAVAELATRTGSPFVAIVSVLPDGRMRELATFNRTEGARSGGEPFGPDLARYLLDRAAAGPWVHDARSVGPAEPTAAFRVAGQDFIANAPLFAGETIVGLLAIGHDADQGGSAQARQARLLAATIDYASVLSAVVGPVIAGTSDRARTRDLLRRILADEAFTAHYQPIVTLEDRHVVGYEALTRFTDGTPPAARFAEALRADLGAEFEVAAVARAIGGATALPAGLLLSCNVSPATVLGRVEELGMLVRGADRPVVLELTEHAPIEDYRALRGAVAAIGPFGIAVDDAGAGYASLRHILELEPTFAKLDISLVRNIDGDELRQAMAAGLEYFAARTGCRLIAEGVETTAEADVLRTIGVELGQGYLFGRAQAAAG
jgi:EAL domain-containing protein (putative c-di-GMP-specific phosphodiesterase class I)/CheY-like chemotaxis protein